jgi:hypothetical protein
MRLLRFSRVFNRPIALWLRNMPEGTHHFGENTTTDAPPPGPPAPPIELIVEKLTKLLIAVKQKARTR